MFSQYFGHYLLNKGLITAERLKDAMDYQKSVHVKLGVLAVNSGYMSAKQVEEVHNLQAKMDKKFGEIAVEKGYITRGQLEKLLATQRQAYLLLSQALVDRNYLTLEELENALNNYKRENSLTENQFKAIQNGDIEEIVNTFVDFRNVINRTLYKSYISLFARNIIRFIDDDIRIESLSVNDKYTSDFIATQNIKGEINLLTCIGAERGMFLKFASKYAGEEIKEADELAFASFGEFLNLSNGIFLVNMSNQGVELDMAPQEISENGEISDLKEVCGVTFHLSFGRFDMIIGKGTRI